MSNSHSQAEALTEVLVLTFIFLSMTEIHICPPHSPVTQWEMVEFSYLLLPLLSNVCAIYVKTFPVLNHSIL